MAGATNTTLGTIKLSGDFIGSHAEAPTLRPSGVKANTYNITDKVYVDAQGRITWAKQLPGDFEWPEGSKTQDGVVQIGVLPEGNRSIDVDANSVISINKATTSDAGVAKLGNGLAKNVGSGATDIVVPAASTTVFGYARPDNSSMQIDNDGVISVDGQWVMDQEGPATTTTTGGVKVGEYFAIDGAGDLSTAIPDATTSVKGLMQIGTGFTYEGATISVPYATSTVKGIFNPKSTNLFIDTDFNKLYLNNCSSPYYGNPEGKIGLVAGVSGASMSIDWPTATISCNYNFDDFSIEASTADKGKAQIGDNIDVNSGVISLPDPTDTIYGPVKVTGRAFKVDAGGALYWDTNYYANATYGGHVRPDGVTIKFSDEPNAVISFNPADTPVASDSAKGIVQIGDGFEINSGIISVPNATASVKGLLQAGSGIDIVNGHISLPMPTVKASKSDFGILTINSSSWPQYGTTFTNTIDIYNGVISLNPCGGANDSGYVTPGGYMIQISDSGVIDFVPPDADDSNLGYATADNLSISINSSSVLSTSIGPASQSTAGLAKINTALLSMSGTTLSVKSATTSSLGIVTAVNNSGFVLDDDSILSLAEAATTYKGIAAPGTGLTISNDFLTIQPEYMPLKTDTVNRFEAGQIIQVGSTVHNGSTDTIIYGALFKSVSVPVGYASNLAVFRLSHDDDNYESIPECMGQSQSMFITYNVQTYNSQPIILRMKDSSGTTTLFEMGTGCSAGDIVMAEVHRVLDNSTIPVMVFVLKSLSVFRGA